MRVGAGQAQAPDNPLTAQAPATSTNPLASQVTSGGNALASPSLLQLLIQIYGYNPFSRMGQAGPRTPIYGPFAGIPPDFVENIIRYQMDKGVDPLQEDPASLTQLVRDYWTNPAFANIRTQFNFVKNQLNSNTALVPALKAAAFIGNAGIAPFNPNTAISGHTFNQPDADYGPGGVHPGIDYGLGMNTPIVAPFGGTVTSKDDGNRNLGKSITFTFGSGYKLVFGHLNSIVANTGSVTGGQLLGYSGSTGNSTGPHLHFEVRDPSGRALDPAAFLKGLASGTPLSQLMNQYGPGLATAPLTRLQQLQQQQGIFDPELHTVYAPIQALYQKYFGRDPTDQELLNILPHGTNEQTWNDYIRSLGSHIPGINIGSYRDLRTEADAQYQNVFGHPSNDTDIKEMFDKGLTSPKGVGFYIDQLPFKPGAAGVSPVLYNAVYKSAAEWTKAVWNQEPRPIDLQTMHHAAGAPNDVPASQANQVAGVAA